MLETYRQNIQPTFPHELRPQSQILSSELAGTGAKNGNQKETATSGCQDDRYYRN